MGLIDRISRAKLDLNAAGYLAYMSSARSRSIEMWIHLPRIENQVRVGKTSEIFVLTEPAYYLDGKPVYVVIRGVPFSIRFQMREDQITDEERERLRESGIREGSDEEFKTIRLVEPGYSASENDAWLRSLYVNILFRKKLYDLSSYLQIGLLNILSALVSGISVYVVMNSKVTALLLENSLLIQRITELGG